MHDPIEITPSSPYWPSGLSDLPAPPTRLWVRGDLAALRTPAITVTGCRAATAYGEMLSTELAAAFAEAGYAVASGLAYGIDGAAHRGTLGIDGKTVAVLAGGADRVYPIGHTSLADRIIDAGGALVSPFAPGTPPTRARFLERQPLLAALSLATVVVEAGSRSGAVLVGTNARLLGRIVGAVPGPVTSAASTGAHQLIRNGALLVDRAQVVLDAIHDASREV